MLETPWMHWSVDDFLGSLGDWERPLFLIAHQDDEVAYGGLIQRLGPKTNFIYLTNGDGLHFEDNVTPEEYAEIRKAEAINAVGAVGIPKANVQCLDHSEVRIYRHFSYLQKNPASIALHRGFFDRIRASVEEAVLDLKPDAIFTTAWQGGHPEHDLTHYFTRLAVDKLEQVENRRVPFFHLPEYEYTIVISFRFHPLYSGPRIKYSITDQELAGKQRIIEQYPSQLRLVARFEKMLERIGKATKMFGLPATPEDYLRIEEIGPVPPLLDYTRSTHWFDFANYMFDDFDGIPVTFKRSIRPIIEAFPRKMS